MYTVCKREEKNGFFTKAVVEIRFAYDQMAGSCKM